MSFKQNVSITILSLIIVFLIVLFSSLIFLKSQKQFSFNLPRPDTSNSTSNYSAINPICESPECVTLAQKLVPLNYRDESIDPCEDFYGFVCGKYHEHSIADNSIKEKSIIISRLIKEFLLINESSTSKSETAMKLLFDKCEELNDPFAEDSEKQAFREIYKDIQGIGSFPMLIENWDASEFDLNDVLSKIAKIGITDFGLFEVSVSSREIKIQPSTRGSLNPVGTKKMLQKLFEVNALDFDEDMTMKDITDVYDLDVRLRNISETQKTEEQKKKLPRRIRRKITWGYKSGMDLDKFTHIVVPRKYTKKENTLKVKDDDLFIWKCVASLSNIMPETWFSAILESANYIEKDHIHMLIHMDYAGNVHKESLLKLKTDLHMGRPKFLTNTKITVLETKDKKKAEKKKEWEDILHSFGAEISSKPVMDTKKTHLPYNSLYPYKEPNKKVQNSCWILKYEDSKIKSSWKSDPEKCTVAPFRFVLECIARYQILPIDNKVVPLETSGEGKSKEKIPLS